MVGLIYHDVYARIVIETASFPRACAMAQGSGVAKACILCEPEVSTWRSMGLCDLGSGIGTRQTPQLQTEWCPQDCMTNSRQW